MRVLIDSDAWGLNTFLSRKLGRSQLEMHSSSVVGIFTGGYNLFKVSDAWKQSYAGFLTGIVTPVFAEVISDQGSSPYV